MHTLVVIPTYREARSIGGVLRRVRCAVPDVDVLVVDDDSPDGTAAKAESVSAELGRVQVLRRPGRSGLAAAYGEGFRWGLERRYEVLVQLDGDLSHDPYSIPRLLAPVAEGADLVLGTRYMAGGSVPTAWPRHRRMLSRWANRYASAALGLGIGDATSGYRAYRSAALEAVHFDDPRARGHCFQIEMVYRMVRQGLRVVEVPIAFVDRTAGRSKMSMPVVAEGLFLVTAWAVSDRLGLSKSPPLDETLPGRRPSADSSR